MLVDYEFSVCHDEIGLHYVSLPKQNIAWSQVALAALFLHQHVQEVTAEQEPQPR